MKTFVNALLHVVIALAIAIVLSNSMSAQVTSYAFTASSGSFTPLSGGTVPSWTGNADDGYVNAIPIGFTFTYLGTAYTQVSANSNGWLNPGAAIATIVASTARTNNLSTGPRLVLAPLWDDLDMTIGTFSYKTEGTAGTQIFTAEWLNAKWNYGAAGAVISFQVKLYEANNQIDFVYRQDANVVNSGSASIGINETATGSGHYLSLNGTGTSPAAGSTVEYTILNTKPATGQVYSFAQVPMSYTSSTTTQNTNKVLQNTTNQQIIGIQIVTTGTLSPLSATELDVNTTGTTNVADISNARIYYTGTSSTFATGTQFGSTVVSPSGSLVFTASQALSSGTNYFWLTYDIGSGATSGNLVDGECTSVTVGTPQTPTDTAPAGSRTILAPMSGTYTVGSSATYATLTAALADLNLAGVGGATVFELQSDYSSAGETLPLTFGAIAGLSVTNTITIRPATAVTAAISGANTTAIISVAGGNYVTFDGRPGGLGSTKALTIENTSAGTSRPTVQFINDANNNAVTYCIVKGSNSSAQNTTSGAILFGASTGTNGNDNNTISYCDITRSGSNTLGSGFGFGGTTGKNNTGNTISHCNIYDWTNNAVSIYAGAANTVISDNNMYRSLAISAADTRVIQIRTAEATSFLRNNIHDLLTTSTSPNIRGIDFYTGSTTTHTTIANNFISLDNSASYNGATINGILDESGSGYLLDVYYNTIYIGGAPTSGTGVTAGFYRTYATTTVFTNNVVYNSLANAGATGNNYAVYVAAAVGTGFTSNYNDLYSAGSSANSLVGSWLGVDKTALLDWQTASSQDANSKSKAVTCSDVTIGNLHLSGGSIGDIDLIGTPIGSVTTDFDGDTRNATYPYMGADENTGSPLPVELTSFTATVRGKNVELAWSTATEINNYGFDIERSIVNQKTKAENWSKVGFVEGRGTTNAPQNYSFSDASTAGKYTYRLKQIDRDGKFTYSNRVEVSVALTAADYELGQNYPNPFNPTTMIRFAVKKQQHVSLKVYNAVGQEAKTVFDEVAQPDEVYQVIVDATGLASGTYFYILQTADRREVKKMLMLK